MLQGGIYFGNQYVTGTAGNTCREGDETGIASHDLNEKQAIMRICRVSDFIYGLDRSVDRRIVADGVIGTIQVVVDGAGNTNNGDVILF